MKRNHASDFKEFEEANEESRKVKKESAEEADQASCSTIQSAKCVYKQLYMNSMVDRMSAWSKDEPCRLKSDYNLIITL